VPFPSQRGDVLMPEAGPLSIADRLEIMELLVRYTWSLDARDANAFAATFAPQGVWQPSTGTGGEGPDAIRAAFDARMGHQSGKLRHLSGAPIIEGNAERCRVRSLCQVVAEAPGGPCATTQVAEYHDTCVKVDGRWLFEHKLVKTVLDGRGT
jgi:uncharacterized protein (TIGR02246 family)